MYAYGPRSTAVPLPSEPPSSSTCNTTPPSNPYDRHSSHELLPVHTEDLLTSVTGHFTFRHQQPLKPLTPQSSVLSSGTTSSLPHQNSTGTDLADFAALLFVLLWYIKPAFGPSLFPTGVANTSTKKILYQTVLRPASSFQTFCRTVLETTKLSLPAVFVGLEFLNRLKDRIRGTTNVVDASPAKLMTVVLMLADKFVTDNAFTVATWAQVTGIPTAQLVKLEFQVLELLDYSIFISKEGYEGWIERLQQFTDEYNTVSCRIMGIVRAQQFRRRDTARLARSAEGNHHLDYRKKANPKIAKATHVGACSSPSVWKRHKTSPGTINQQDVVDEILQPVDISGACQNIPFIVGAPAPVSEDFFYPLNAGNCNDVPMSSMSNAVSDYFSSQEHCFSQTGALLTPSIPPSYEQAVGSNYPFTPPEFQDRTFSNTLPFASSEGIFSYGPRYESKIIPLKPTTSFLDPLPFYIPQPYYQQMHAPYFADRNRYSSLAV